MSRPRIAVIGAGLMGRLTALALQPLDAELHLFDRGDLDGRRSAAHVAAGMLAPASESVISDALVINMALKAMPLWPGLLSQLSLPVFYQQQGSLVVAHQQDKGSLAQFEQQLAQKARTFSELAAKHCTGSDIARLEPDLAGRFAQGLWLPGEGQLCNRCFLRSTQASIQSSAIRFHGNWQVVDIDSGCVSARQADDSLDPSEERWDFDLVIDCRGSGARLPGLRSVRGEVLRVTAKEVSLHRPVRLMHPRYPLYIVPRKNNGYVIGATEIESQDSGNVTVRSALELLSAAYAVHPGFAEARIDEMQSHCRPALADNNPAIRLGDALIQVNGLYRHGFLLAPSLLEEVKACISAMLALDAESTFEQRRAQSPFPCLYHLA